jgi:MvdD pre-ATP grasp domain
MPKQQMTSESPVLIVSSLADLATDEVVRRLTARGIPLHRLNTEDYPFSSALVFQPGNDGEQPWIALDGKELPAPTTIWYRRLRSPSKPEEMDQDIYNFCLQEGRAALLGSIMGLRARWMSYPTAVWQAEFKPIQLQRAGEIGLTIPRTVITNDPRVIRKSFGEFGSMVVKPSRTGHISSQGKEFAIFTSRVLEQHLDNLESARWSPAIYQELVPKSLDVRITVVGEKLFAAGIESQGDPQAMVVPPQIS